MRHVFCYSALKVIGKPVKTILKTHPRKQFFGNISDSIQYFSMKPNGTNLSQKATKSYKY